MIKSAFIFRWINDTIRILERLYQYEKNIKPEKRLEKIPFLRKHLTFTSTYCIIHIVPKIPSRIVRTKTTHDISAFSSFKNSYTATQFLRLLRAFRFERLLAEAYFLEYTLFS